MRCSEVFSKFVVILIMCSFMAHPLCEVVATIYPIEVQHVELEIPQILEQKDLQFSYDDILRLL